MEMEIISNFITSESIEWFSGKKEIITRSIFLFGEKQCLEVRNGNEYDSVSLCPAQGTTSLKGSGQMGKSLDTKNYVMFEIRIL